MPGMCEGRVAIVTGAGRGIGREYALMLAEQGAKVIVNDLGAARDGTGADASPAQQVVDEITAMGGEAAVNGADVSDFDAAKRDDRPGRGDLRWSRRRRQQRRHPARSHAHQHDRGGVGPRHQGPPEGHVRARSVTRRPTGGNGRRTARPTTPGSSTRRRSRASTATSARRTTARRSRGSRASPSSPRSSWSATA